MAIDVNWGCRYSEVCSRVSGRRAPRPSGSLDGAPSGMPDRSSDCFSLVLDGGAFLGRVLMVFHSGFEAANTVSDSFAEFRKLFRPEHEQGNPKITSRCMG